METHASQDTVQPQLLDYSHVKACHIEDSVTTTLHAIPLEAASLVLQKARYRPYLYCLCVHDSPQNPCLCKGPIIWLPFADILKEGASGRKDKDGRDVLAIRMSADTRVLVDTQVPTTAQEFIDVVAKGGFDGLRFADGSSIASAAKPNRVIVSAIANAIVAAIDWLSSLDWEAGSGRRTERPL